MTTTDPISIVAEAIRDAMFDPQQISKTGWDDAARAAVAALAGMGDITDEELAKAIYAALDDDGVNFAAGLFDEKDVLRGVAAVRALLARQAAVHATRIAELTEAVQAAARLVNDARLGEDEAESRAEAAEAAVVKANDLAASNMYRFQRAEAKVAALRATVGRVRALTFVSDDGTEYEHVALQCDGQPDCPACWAESIRAALDGAS